MYLSLFFCCSEVILKIMGGWFRLFQQTLVFLLTPARAGRASVKYVLYTYLGVKTCLIFCCYSSTGSLFGLFFRGFGNKLWGLRSLGRLLV